MSYATGDELVLRYDRDWVGDLATDDRETQAIAHIPEHPAVLAVLEDASGEIQSALAYGGRYKPEDLDGLTGLAKAQLVRLTCDLAMIYLRQRRPEARQGNMEQDLQSAMDRLERLRKGDNVFLLPETIDASVVDHDGPTPVDLKNRNDLTERMHRYFPTSESRLPRAQGGSPG